MTSLKLKLDNESLAGQLSRRAGELQAVLDAAPVAVWIAHDPECLRITGNAYADRILLQDRARRQRFAQRASWR